MFRVALASETDWNGWRDATRALVLAGVAPNDIAWSVGGESDPPPNTAGRFTVPGILVRLAQQVIQARAPDRFALLYDLIASAHAGTLSLDGSRDRDPDQILARRLALAVRADAHRMRTHLRFTPVAERYLGYYAPAHYVLEANALLLAERYPSLRLSVLTPDLSAHIEAGVARFGPGVLGIDDDATLLAWWDAHGTAALAEAGAGSAIPPGEALDEAPRPPDRRPIGPVVFTPRLDNALQEAAVEAAACQRCDLFDRASQTVFGEGSADARLMFVGEQPGDQEDVIGRPFVGPAGQLLDQALEETGIDRRAIYITNAVKHFKFTPRGGRRIHQPPDAGEIEVCRFWLDLETSRLRPALIVLMGGSAARAVLGRPVTVTRERGRAFRLQDGTPAMITVHPSYLLRIPDGDAKAREYAAFVRDLRLARSLAEGVESGSPILTA
jgi:DNA polymerase